MGVVAAFCLGHRYQRLIRQSGCPNRLAGCLACILACAVVLARGATFSTVLEATSRIILVQPSLQATGRPHWPLRCVARPTRLVVPLSAPFRLATVRHGLCHPGFAAHERYRQHATPPAGAHALLSFAAASQQRPAITHVGSGLTGIDGVTTDGIDTSVACSSSARERCPRRRWRIGGKPPAAAERLREAVR